MRPRRSRSDTDREGDESSRLAISSLAFLYLRRLAGVTAMGA
jgi:hypothetical protein